MNSPGVIVATRAAAASLCDMMHQLCYPADANFISLVADSDVSQSLVGELYPSDYQLMVRLFVDAFVGEYAQVRLDNFRLQYRDAVRIMSELNYVWVDFRGMWASPVDNFDVPRDVRVSMLNQMHGVLVSVYDTWDSERRRADPRHMRGVQQQSKSDADTMVNFLVNIAAGDVYVARCAELGVYNEQVASNLAYLEQFFGSVLVGTRRLKKRHLRRAQLTGTLVPSV